MSELDYLEALNNKDLRAECMRYGLPNVPVTDSSRKLLIRRLRLAIDGAPAAPSPATKSAKRRETTAPTPTQPIEVVDTRNRRTFAETTSPPAAAVNGRTRITPITVESRRGINSSRSGVDLRGGGAFYETPPRSRSVSLSKSDVVTTSYRQEREQTLPEDLELDEEDFVHQAEQGEHYDRTRYNYLNAQKPTQRLPFEPSPTARSPLAPRSRSVSLSKSGVVTTSYVQEIVPLERKAPTEPTANNFMDELDYEKNAYYKQSSPGAALAFCTPILNSTRYSGLENISANRSYTTAASPSTLHSNNTGGGAYNVSYEEQQSAEEEEETGQSSDDQQQEEEEEEPIYKSEFTRQLAQHPKSEPKPAVRRRRLPTDNASSVEDSLRQFVSALDQKYHLKQWMVLLLGLLLAIFLYVFFIEK